MSIHIKPKNSMVLPVSDSIFFFWPDNSVRQTQLFICWLVSHIHSARTIIIHHTGTYPNDDSLLPSSTVTEYPFNSSFNCNLRNSTCLRCEAITRCFCVAFDPWKLCLLYNYWMVNLRKYTLVYYVFLLFSVNHLREWHEWNTKPAKYFATTYVC